MVLSECDKLWSMADIQTAVRVRGGHWFDKETMRFFKSRLGEVVYQGAGGIYFVSSEQPPHGKRQFSVRQFIPVSADIRTVGEFCSMSRD